MELNLTVFSLDSKQIMSNFFESNLDSFCALNENEFLLKLIEQAQPILQGVDNSFYNLNT